MSLWPFALVWLVIVWVALWGDLTLGNIVAGLVVATAVVIAMPIRRLPGMPTRVRPLRLARFVGSFTVKLLEANAVVAWEVLTPSNRRVNEGIVAIPLCRSSDLAVTILANAITLTPGTLVVDIGSNPTTLFIHVLHLRSIEDVRRSTLRLEWLLIRALGDDEPSDDVAEALVALERRNQ